MVKVGGRTTYVSPARLGTRRVTLAGTLDEQHGKKDERTVSDR